MVSKNYRLHPQSLEKNHYILELYTLLVCHMAPGKVPRTFFCYCFILYTEKMLKDRATIKSTK